MSNYRCRMVAELAELADRGEKLRSFMESRVFDELGAVDRELLIEQCEVMRKYSDVLVRRLARATGHGGWERD